MLLWSGIVIVLITCCGVLWLRRLDQENLHHNHMEFVKKQNKKEHKTEVEKLLFFSFLVSVLNTPDVGTTNKYCFVITLSILWGCLLAACVMDVESKMIYNYVWWIAGLAGIVLLGIGNTGNISGLIMFTLLQEFFFCRFYGRADCHAFVICAVVITAFGASLQGYLMQMLLACGLLTLVQGIRKNIGKGGNLKEPVPFLPYISVSLWLILFFYQLIL